MTFSALLPFPPSLNAAVRHARNGNHYPSPEAKQFRKDAVLLLHAAKHKAAWTMLTEPCAVLIELYPPDRRRRDADNRIKAVLDCLQLARIVDDDRLCRDIRVASYDGLIRKGGECRVTVRLLDEQVPSIVAAAHRP
jgi:crossover junction endodeoxyribonuclease RusA